MNRNVSNWRLRSSLSLLPTFPTPFYISCLFIFVSLFVCFQVWLALSGIVSTGMAIAMAFGLCSAFGLFYGPVHSALPFLLIGKLNKKS